MKYRIQLGILEKTGDGFHKLKDEQTIDMSEFNLNRLVTYFNAIKGKRWQARKQDSILK